ncbi:hypothetical protein A4S06_08365 [Erysipelotrichaceae bacterium MTC7]|nr:hypothetical protein A4S06_08365 [Erysipelotrichaceae bacterium MTC7]
MGENVKEKFIQEHGDTLWHYTSPTALTGIFQNDEFWFGNYDNLNDHKELIMFKEEVLEELRKDPCNCFDRMKEIETEIENQAELFYFSFSLSKARDDVSMWDRYARGGTGVAIVFNTDVLYTFLEHILNDKIHENLTLIPINYEKNIKKSELLSVLKRYRDGKVMGGFNSLSGAISNLHAVSYMHKHKSFTSEQEVRMHPLFVKKDDSNVKLITSETIRVVYVLKIKEKLKELGIKMEDLIDSIVIGPKSSQGEKDLELFFSKLNYPELAKKVLVSDCPLK